MRDEVHAMGECDRLCTAVHVELAEQVLDVSADRARADHELLRDLRLVQALRK